MEGMFSEGAEGIANSRCGIRKGTKEKLGRKRRRKKLGDRNKSTEGRGRGAYISDSRQSSRDRSHSLAMSPGSEEGIRSGRNG